jgi:hypothetical protein
LIGEEQNTNQDDQTLDEDAEGFGRRRLKQWFNGANPAEFTPAETPENPVNPVFSTDWQF